MSGQIERINTCANCIFSHREGDLYCRRDPPVGHPIAIVQQNESGEVVGAKIVSFVSCWPTVQPTQFCGQHRELAIVQAREIPKQLQTFGR